MVAELLLRRLLLPYLLLPALLRIGIDTFVSTSSLMYTTIARPSSQQETTIRESK